jgi:aerobic carbon-monoxide dehydrogenase medium subunit
MKPAPFAYEAPRSVAAAVRLLGEEAKALAGGQSLVPMLNFRRVRPALVVDLNRLDELAHLRHSEMELRIGALTRQVAVERSELVEREWPLLRQAVALVGHTAIRTRGTVGGSAAHADPCAELSAALLALDARFELRSERGQRSVPAEEFFLGPGRTVVRANELLTEIVVPALPPGARTAFVEHAPTRGDFAVAGAAAVVVPREQAAIALLGVGPTPVRALAAERAVIGGAEAREAASLAVAGVEGKYRRALVAELVRRALVSSACEERPVRSGL